MARGVDVASASTISLDAATGQLVDITGTTTVATVTLGDGKQRLARAVGALQLTASASLVVNGSASVNYTTRAGDLLIFEGYSSGVVRAWAVGATIPVEAQINAAADTAFSDADMLPARKDADGSLIKRSWANIKAALNTFFKGLASVAVAAGDLIVGTGANTLGRLAAGANGKILTMVSGAPAWADAPAGGVPVPTSNILPVGAYAMGWYNSAGSVANGGTLAGSNLSIATVSPTGAYNIENAQTGTWMNISSVSLNSSKIGLWVRIS